MDYFKQPDLGLVFCAARYFLLTFVSILTVFSIGFDKGGLPGIAALGMAFALTSVNGGAGHVLGLLVPVLFLADICAAYSFRNDVQWHIIRRLSVPCIVGMMIGVIILSFLPDEFIKIAAGYCLALLALSHFMSPYVVGAFVASNPLPTDTTVVSASKSPASSDSLSVAWLYGLLIGIFTVIANIAGPVAVVYFIQLGLTKYEMNGTRSWLFVLANLVKIPTQFMLGNLEFADAILVLPLALIAVLSTFFAAAFIVPIVDQNMFERIAWVLVIFCAMKLILQF